MDIPEDIIRDTTSLMRSSSAKYLQIRSEGCCRPSFIVGLARPWLIIAGAMFTSEVTVQRLTEYLWLRAQKQSC
ncbi:hypothetical protein IW261DRAFT_1455604 [Armillaria novae-zelandiae]|uniref:Uncharacterized protein n=1 Tax=Armillaria novae-zelandiae TaxID=153914 RepID=A0AA39PLE3_9AGAR|nr:hypothetical protein IW261DRAFT_1455604 [Armillaria novae-zelandiae]